MEGQRKARQTGVVVVRDEELIDGRYEDRPWLTNRNGNPMCARVRPPDIAWSAGQRG